jgi:predicted lysophospholipase L1 biosynthesis ABC-type transport system permease subunit
LIVPLIIRITGQPIRETAGILIHAVVALLPRFVLYSVPAVAAIRDVRRDGRPRPTWLEWTGLILAAALFLVAEPTEIVRYYSVAGPGESWAVETLVRGTTLFAALLLGVFLDRISRGARSPG